MSINAYGGLQGSGKSYQVVKEVIIPQLARGRKIVTSIRGVKYDKIREHLIATGVEEDKIGSIRVVARTDIQKENFYPKHDTASDTFDDTDSVVKRGEMIIIDEAASYYAKGMKVADRVLQFWNEHRHSVDTGTGQSTDIIVITPDIKALHLLLKGVIDTAFVCRKHKEVGGAKAKTYVCAMYQGPVSSRMMEIDSKIKTYDPLYFQFYESHAGGKAGDETTIDARQQVFSVGNVLRFIAIAFLLVVGLGYFAWKRYSASLHLPEKKPTEIAADGSQAVSQGKGGQNSAGAAQIPATPPKKRHTLGATDISTDLRVVGVVYGDRQPLIVIQDANGRMRMVPAQDAIYREGNHVTLKLDDEYVTEFSGPDVALPGEEPMGGRKQ